MRSRYAAYALGLHAYVIETTHPDGPIWSDDRRQWRRQLATFTESHSFDALEILDATEPDDDDAHVTFRAGLSHTGTEPPTDASFTERSCFRKHEGRWAYVGPAADQPPGNRPPEHPD